MPIPISFSIRVSRPSLRDWKRQEALGRGSEPPGLSTGLPEAEWSGARYHRILSDLQRPWLWQVLVHGEFRHYGLASFWGHLGS